MEHVKELLSGFLDQALPGVEQRRVEAHLAACGECREELSELRAVSSLVSSLPRRPLPRGFLQRLQNRRAARRISPDPWPFSWPLPARAAAFALSGLLVMFVLYDKIQLLFPVSPTAMLAGSADEARLRLERPRPLGLESRAGSATPAAGKTLARAKGAPVDPALAALDKAAAPRAPEPPAKAETALLGNEDLQKNLDAEKERMGIKKILPPEPKRFSMGQLAGLRGANSAFETQRLLAAPPATSLGGATPTLLSERGLRSSPGGPLTGGGAGSGSAAASGRVLRSEEQRAALWMEKKLRLAPPRVDYSRQMVVVVLAPDAGWAVEIAAVRTSADRVAVLYRISALPEAARGPEAPVPYQARAITRTELPVIFEKLP